MASGYTVFFSYILTTDTGKGFSDAIHCNYINSVYLDTIINKEVNIYFNNQNDFRFLDNGNGTGFSVNRIFILLQLVDNTKFDDTILISPTPDDWRLFETTNQVTGYTSGMTLNKVDLTTTIFRIPIYLYNTLPNYNLDYLNYPTQITLDNDNLCFGEEEIFLGNVSTNIEAIAYSTDLVIQLDASNFNFSTNKTWNSGEDIYITEIGIYDDEKNLIAIGKLNNPIKKNNNTSRSIVFGIDF
jgi:hypothetical protein